MVDEQPVQEAKSPRDLLGKPGVQGLLALISVIIAVVAIIVPLVITDTPERVTPAVTWTPVVPQTHTSTLTPTPTPGTQIAIEIDEQDAGDDFCRDIAPNSSHLIQVKVRDAVGDIIPPDAFSYKWRFNPPDSHNEEKIKEGFRCNAVAYYASAELDNQTVTVEVLKEKKTVIVRSICFNVARLP